MNGEKLLFRTPHGERGSSTPRGRREIVEYPSKGILQAIDGRGQIELAVGRRVRRGLSRGGDHSWREPGRRRREKELGKIWRYQSRGITNASL